MKTAHIIGKIRWLAKNCPKPNKWFAGELLLSNGATCYVSGTAVCPVSIGMTVEFDCDAAGEYYKGQKQYTPLKGQYITRVFVTKREVVDFLSSNMFPGVGKTTAERIYDTYGSDTMSELYNNLSTVASVCGLKQNQIDSINDGLRANIGGMELLKAFPNMSLKTAQRILDQNKKAIPSVIIAEILNDPYTVMCSSYHMSLFEADRVAVNDIGVALTDQMRIESIFYDALSNYMRDKHATYVLFSGIREYERFYHRYVIGGKSAKLPFPDEWDGVPLTRWNCMYDHILHWSDNDMLKLLCISAPRKNSAGSFEVALYRKDMYEAENIIAGFVAHACDGDDIILAQRKAKFAAELKRRRMYGELTGYTDEQIDAVKSVFEHSLSFLSGGPGRGKTHTVRLVLSMWMSIVGDSVLMLAPTGKAVTRVKSQTGWANVETVMRFVTMNRQGVVKKGAKDLFDVSSGSFIIDTQFSAMPIDRNTLIVVDEASMLDFCAVRQLIDNIKGCTVLFVGDKDQLPPIEPGPFFAEALNSGRVHLTVLHKNFRTKVPEINDNADRILNGRTDLKYTPDFMAFVTKEHPVDGHELSSSEEYILNFYRQRCREGADHSDIMVLTPFASERYRLSSSNLNRLLQTEILGPCDDSLNFHTGHDDYGTYYEDKGFNTGILDSDGVQIRIGDRIMNVKNDIDLRWHIFTNDDFGFKDRCCDPDDGSNAGIFNGDTGTVIRKYSATAAHDVMLCIALDDNRSADERSMDPRPTRFVWAVADTDSKGVVHISNWSLCYAMSIHKAQGSEADHVIIAISEDGYRGQLWRQQVDDGLPFLTRNLLYTAVTRAKQTVTLLGSKEALFACVQSPYVYTNVRLMQAISEVQ